MGSPRGSWKDPPSVRPGRAALLTQCDTDSFDRIRTAGAGSAPDHPNAVAVVLSIVGIVTVSTLAIAAAIALLGRAMTPKRRRRGDQVATLDA